MDHPLLGRITHRRRKEAWVCKVSLPPMAEWQVIYSRVHDSFIESEPEPPCDQFDVEIRDPDALGPSAEQDAAISDLLHNQEQYAQALLFEISRRVASSLAAERELQLKTKCWVSLLIDRTKELRLDTPEGAAKLVTLQTIDILRQARDGLSYTMWHFEWGWDIEHGLTVVMHGTKALAAGVQVEFCDDVDVEFLIRQSRRIWGDPD